jgi:DNA-binding transcriptional ArsR family regulator
MPGSQPQRLIVSLNVTPRFDVFYALRALGERRGAPEEWIHDAERSFPRSFKGMVGRIAPRPVMWALLADALRDGKPDPTFEEIRETINSLDNGTFQRAVLSGVFGTHGNVDALIAGNRSLSEAVSIEGKSTQALLTLLGLHPFHKSSPVATAFTRIITEPAEFRADLTHALEAFWHSVFRDTWRSLEPRLSERVDWMREMLNTLSLAEFANTVGLPVSFDDRKKEISAARGAKTFSYGSVRELHVIPSAFNDARFWGAYADNDGSVRLYFPVFDAALAQTDRPVVDPELGFRALGDTTRYAMAAFLAQSPRTSVELAKEFGVSKATVSHHVGLLRSAGLLDEQPTERGTLLTLNREALDGLSSAAAREMFTYGRTPVMRRSRRETRMTKRSRKISAQQAVTSTGDEE